MKTNEELIALAQEKHMQFIGAERAAVCMLLDICRRETWQSATKAQMDTVKEHVGTNAYLWDDEIEEITLARFPGDPT